MDFRPRRASLPGALAPLVAVLPLLSACTSGDGATKAAVPSPGAEAARLCRDLAGQLPAKVAGERRRDPEPKSQLTAGWGDPAILLRCGVARPERMSDVKADGVEVNGVGWLMEKRDDGSFRFTTALRKAYVEVTLPKDRTDQGLGPLTDFAEPVRRTVPEGVAAE